uniref:F-box protein n=1 Tax=Anthurium amnicola TaxID=1678845 RepID=A0A1D1XM14_9ARAE
MGSPPMPFSDFPEDVQLSILSFLRPAEVAAFACTSRRSASLCGQTRLWLSMCDRRWGSKTRIRSWAGAGGGVPFALLYRALDRWENLIGFWRRIGRGAAGTPPLVFFEWGPSFITGSRVSPSPGAGGYGVVKIPFLWMGLSPRGEAVSFVHPACRFETGESLEKLASGSGVSDSDLVPVTLSFMGGSHFVVEENRTYYAGARGGDEFGSCEDLMSVEESSPPERLMAEIYQYFANRTSPGGDKAFRKQRKKERDRLGRRRWEAEHFVKISNCCPTSSRPLQGLWKGICENMSLDFYLVTYDDVGSITCWKVGDASEPFSVYSPVFCTSNMAFLEHPFSKEEEDIYDGREHIQPPTLNCTCTERIVSRILCINSSYDLVVPNSSSSSVLSQTVEGRIWEYDTGTFGFGFLQNNYIVDLKLIALNGCLLDTVEPPCKSYCNTP